MRSRNLFLLVYLLWSCSGASNVQGNKSCPPEERCGQKRDSTSQFLQCVGLPSSDSGKDHLRRLKGMLEATMDVYTFMRSSMSGVPILSLQGALQLNPDIDPYQNEDLVHMWLEVKMKPLLKSITKHFLSCLSTRNFSCSTYQTVVRELSDHFSDMDPVRQKWIYTFFMYPFLAGDRVDGCVKNVEGSEEWLIRNFGAFKAMARMKDFSELNMLFSGLDVLHLLTPAQKAEILLQPEVARIDNTSIHLVFQSLMSGGPGPGPDPHPSVSPGWGHNWTTPGFPQPKPTFDPFRPQSIHDPTRGVAKQVMDVFKPIGSFVHGFVSFTRERDPSDIRSTTLTQFLLNWTLSALADRYRPKKPPVVPQMPMFDLTNVEDWYQQVVMPLLWRFLPEEFIDHPTIKMAFHEVFFLDHGHLVSNETSDVSDVCSISLDRSPCGLSDAVQNVAHVMYCAAHTNLVMSEKTVQRLIMEMLERLNSLIKELTKTNFNKLACEIQEIFRETEPPAMTREHLRDPDFIKLWFKIKLMPLLPDVPTGLLSCLSTKNFSCPVYQTIVAALSKHLPVLDTDPMYSRNIYEHFIFPFLLHHNTSDPQCVLSANNSEEWLVENFRSFSVFASVTDFYDLNPNFFGLEVLPLLTPKQKAEMMLVPLRAPPEKEIVIDRVFNFLLMSPEEIPEVLRHLVRMAPEVDPPCSIYARIFMRLYDSISLVPPPIEPVIWETIDDIISFAPMECLPENVTCPMLQFNDTNTCRKVDSSQLLHHLNMSMEVPCNFTLETYACAQLENFTAHQLVSLLKCNLPGNSSHSTVLWKMLLTKLSPILEPALNMLANTSMVIPSAREVLNVIGEIRLSFLTDKELRNSSIIMKWFPGRLSSLLPFASGRFLHCLSSRNISCRSYQQILQVFIHRFDNMSSAQQHLVLKDFILRFLSHSGPSCVTNNSAEWLRRNLGPFSAFLSVRDLTELNPIFRPLDVLRLLSPKQNAELLVLSLPTLLDKEDVINMLFDHLADSSDMNRFQEFLFNVVFFLQEGNLSCSAYRTLFTRLDLALATAHRDVESSIMHTKVALSKHIPTGCIIYNGQCNFTVTNETEICASVNSTMLQLHLNSGNLRGRVCDFSPEEFACARLQALTAGDLAVLLACNHSSNSSGSRPVWKLLLSKASHVLDEALDHLSNQTLDPRSPAVSMILDAIREVRLDTFSLDSFNNPALIRLWLRHRLFPFRFAVSPDFLSCLTTKGFNCTSFQHVVQILSSAQPHMSHETQMFIITHFIEAFLTMNETAGPSCVSNNSEVWLLRNLGRFSVLLSISDLARLNPFFNPLDVLSFLSPKQNAELLVSTLPMLQDKEDVINTLFDHLANSTDTERLKEFLLHAVFFLQEGNLSCSSYRGLFKRLDSILAHAPTDVEMSIMHTKVALSQHLPPACNLFNGQCSFTVTNEMEICAGVNSTTLQLHLNSGKLGEQVCSFPPEAFACAQLQKLTAEDLATLLACNYSSFWGRLRPVWKLLLSKASHVLDEALDQLSKTPLDPRSPAVSMILDAIREVRLETFSPGSFNNPAFIQRWLNTRLRPFLPAVSPDFLSCLTTKGFNCTSFHLVVQILGRAQPRMTHETQMSIFRNFIEVFLMLNDTADPGCTAGINSSTEWVQRNLGGFSHLASVDEIQRLYPEFTALEALEQLSVGQIAELASTPGQLTTPAQAEIVMSHIPDHLFAEFFDDFSPALVGHEDMLPSDVRSSILQIVFDRANLTDHSVSDSVLFLWLHNRMRPLLVNLSALHVAPYFMILTGRSCNTQQLGVESLNGTILSLSGNTQSEIFSHIVQSLEGPELLRCYGDNFNRSVYTFLVRRFAGFRFPNLSIFLSLMPPNRLNQLLNSMLVLELGDFLRRPGTVDNDAQLCTVYKNYKRTPIFLETERLPAAVRRPTLPCVWPTALSSTKRSEVDAWFERRLPSYTPFLTRDLISPSITHNASCLAFQRIVKVVAAFNFSAADFKGSDFSNTIRDYLTSSSAPRCYNPSDPDLNSTAWFVEYVGNFITFLTLEDIQSFGSQEVIQVFTVNRKNIALFNQPGIPVNVTNFYTALLYQQDSNFNPLLLPPIFWCVAPGLAFTQLNAAQSMTVLHNLTSLCTDPDPQIGAALASNLGNNIDASAISALGSQSIGMSTGQILMINPQDLFSSLSTLSSVAGWNRGQARAIIRILMSSGMMQINSASSLISLGSLVIGLPASAFTNIQTSELMAAAQSSSFLRHFMSAPAVVRRSFVTRIIAINSNSDMIIQNVPDELATEVPRVQLVSLSSSQTVITRLNRKTWTRQQVELFFNVIAAESSTTILGSANNLSSSVLQGFTCTSVRTITKVQVRRLIRACRRSGSRRVKLVETQLTCMYNHISGDAEVTDFNVFPHDMLMYYDYSLVPRSSCRSYFVQLADADFSVFSNALSYKRTDLFDNARNCLGVTNTTLTRDNVAVLGNMCCYVDGSFIANSDPLILEKLKQCKDLTTNQAESVKVLLESGRTQFGAPSTWNENSLKGLGILPLYLTSTFYNNFDRRTIMRFFRTFRRDLRRNGVSRRLIGRMKREIRRSTRRRTRRSADNECTVGQITQVTISDEAFPLDYDDITQFICCLSATVVKDNLAALAQKVDEEEYQRIVLDKLNEAYPSNITETEVRVLGPVSRVATMDDINKWETTQLETLSSLMTSSDGGWNSSLAAAIITKYLSNPGNTLGSAELDAIGGPNLCFLDVDVLKNITKESIKSANALDVTNCTLEKKKVLFNTARQAFSQQTRMTISASTYQLIAPYTGGADSSYVQSLVASKINMDVATFIGLDESVVMGLTVNNVRDLLGTHLPDLKAYENETLVRNWTSNRLQSDLDTLGIGLNGGRADTTADPAATTKPGATNNPAATTKPGATNNPAATTKPGATNNPAATTKPGATNNPAATTKPGATNNPVATTKPGATNNPAATTKPGAATNPAATTASGSGSSNATTTGSSGDRVRADAGFSFIALLLLLITSQHILV